jgi:signal transduction histidine kinase
MDECGIIFVNGYKSNGFVVIEVIDKGIGMNDKEVNLLGTPFYSLSRFSFRSFRSPLANKMLGIFGLVGVKSPGLNPQKKNPIPKYRALLIKH